MDPLTSLFFPHDLVRDSGQQGIASPTPALKKNLIGEMKWFSWAVY